MTTWKAQHCASSTTMTSRRRRRVEPSDWTVAADRLPVEWRQLSGRRETACHEIGQRFELGVGHSLELLPFALLPFAAIECGLEIDWRRVQGDQLIWSWPRERHFFCHRNIRN